MFLTNYKRRPPHASLLMGVAVLVMSGMVFSHLLRIGVSSRLPLPWLAAVLAFSLAACLSRRNTVALIVAGLTTGALLDTLRWRQFDTEYVVPQRVYEAVIADTPQHKGRTSRMKVRLTGSAVSPVMLTTLRDTTLERGRHILFKAALRKVQPALRPYFHYDTWLLHQGVYWRAFSPRHTLVPDSLFAPYMADRLRARLRASSLSAESEAVAEAMVLGSKSGISPSQRGIYADAGGSHLLALSGLHLGILVGMLTLLLGRSYRFRFLRLIIALPIVWGYVWLTGAPPSLVRAAAMFSAWMAADCIGRHVAGMDSLAVAVLCIIAVRPFWLFDTGFQLSVLSLTGILSVGIVRRNLGISFRFRNRVLRYLSGLLLMSVAATVATAPVVATTFHRIPLLGWIMSLVYIPITTLVVPLCFLLMAVPMPWVATIVDVALGFQMDVMQHTGAVVEDLYPSWITVAIAYVVMLLFVYRRYVAMSFAAATLVISLVADRRIPIEPYVSFEDGHAMVVHSRRTMHRLPCADTTYYRHGFYACPPFTILRADREAWKWTSRSTPCEVDYLWVCRGYKGRIDELLKSVKPRHIIFDPEVPDSSRLRFFGEQGSASETSLQ